jgi:hypothetical protein
LAKLNPEEGIAVARRIADPALRSWAWREIAVISGDANLFQEAAKSARQVNEPVRQAYALWEIGAASGETALFSEAAQVLDQIEGPALAFALADLAAAAGDGSLATQISPEYPAAQTLAYLGLEDYKNAWNAATKIADPFERARAQSAIVAAWGNLEAAVLITNPLLRDRALRDVSFKTGNPALVGHIQDSYYRVQMLIAAGQYQAAWDAAEDLRDGYPLVALGKALAQHDPQNAAQVLDVLDREIDKANLLRAIAAATGQPEDFERALGMALAARVRGDALSPVQTSLALATTFATATEQFEAAISQAYDAAQKINIIY